MTKDELRRYGAIRKELDDLHERLQNLERSKGCHGMSYGDMPHTRGEPIAEAERYVEQKDALERMYKRKTAELYDEQLRIESAIDALPPDLRRLMRLRYIDCKSCEEVCAEMHIAWRTFHRWHGNALEEVKKWH